MPVWNKVKGAAAKAAGAGGEKMRRQAERVALEKRLKEVQRRLGKLVYVQKKTGRVDVRMVERYTREMDALNKALAGLGPPRGRDALKVHVCGEENTSGPFWVAGASRNHKNPKTFVFVSAGKFGGNGAQ